MIVFNKVPLTGDPWEHQQKFERLNINVLCCRYCWLSQWSSQGMAFPYWRLYWNKTEGAYVIFKQKVYLTPGSILLIPPYTPFSTGIEGNETQIAHYRLKGGWITNEADEAFNIELGNILHLYIHFNLGMVYDSITPGIYSFEAGKRELELISGILSNLKQGSNEFNFYSSLSIYHMIISKVNQLPEYLWVRKKIDARIQGSIKYIEQNLSSQLENKLLASDINMAPNSFSRLFKENMDATPRQFINKLRVDKACDMLHHTSLSIDKIAEQCGFFDRYHFSKIFTKTMKVTPAYYRRSFVLGT